MKRVWCALLAAGMSLLATCRQPSSESHGPLLIMAAGSLDRVMPALADAFRATRQREVTVVTGASGSLAAQLDNGAPADVFLAADEATVDRLIVRGVLDSTSRIEYARGVLALVWRRDIRPPASLQAVAQPRFAVVAMANPEVAPYGAAARSALQASALWAQVLPRIVYGESIVGAWQLVQSGNADVGLVALSLVTGSDSVRAMRVDPALYPPIRHAAAAVSASRHPDRLTFLAFMQSDTAQVILRKHGFDAPR